jgi:hypothetical protein
MRGAQRLQRCRAEGPWVWILSKNQDHQGWTLQGAQEQRLPLWRIQCCRHHESHPGKNPTVCWYQVWQGHCQQDLQQSDRGVTATTIF